MIVCTHVLVTLKYICSNFLCTDILVYIVQCIIWILYLKWFIKAFFVGTNWHKLLFVAFIGTNFLYFIWDNLTVLLMRLISPEEGRINPVKRLSILTSNLCNIKLKMWLMHIKIRIKLNNESSRKLLMNSVITFLINSSYPALITQNTCIMKNKFMWLEKTYC